MSETKKEPCSPFEHHQHAHQNGRRCCGRLLTEKCSPEEQAANTDSKTGKKSCCKSGQK